MKWKEEEGSGSDPILQNAAACYVQEEMFRLERHFSRADRVVMGSAKIRELFGEFDETAHYELAGLPVELTVMDKNILGVVNDNGFSADWLDAHLG